MKWSIPEFALVVLVGPSGAGKSTFAARHFRPTEVLSSDRLRGWVRDDETDQSATPDAFEILHAIAAKRLAARRLTVIDATNVRPEDRRTLVNLARKFHALAVAVVFDVPAELCVERNRSRPDRPFGPQVIFHQLRTMRRSLHGLPREGFRSTFYARDARDLEAVTIVRERLWTDRRHDHGPFDIIGDLHGCCDELEELLTRLGYQLIDGVFQHPDGRKVVFLGDFVDRGPRNLDTLTLAMNMVDAGHAVAVPGNHDVKFSRKLSGANVRVGHGMLRTLAELDALPTDARSVFVERAARFIDGLVSHAVLDDGRLVVAHAGLAEELHNRASGVVREFCLYGATTGETDADGLPVRLDWAADYRGRAAVVYGHTAIAEPQWVNNTLNIDTGCVYGGRLTALRWPERELVAVPAAREYFPPARPLAKPAPAADDLPDLTDVTGVRRIATRLRGTIRVGEGESAAALEVMSRFAADPRWLIYLPPTMAPSATSREDGYLEHPAEALADFRAAGVDRVVCEEKHMGSRAVVVACRDAAAARDRFGVATGEAGVIYTRTGRRFFDDAATESAVLERVRTALTECGAWERFGTDWACLDCELMPWSAKAVALLQQQYASVGAAAGGVLAETIAVLERAVERDPAAAQLLDRTRQRLHDGQRFVEAYRRYCWPVNSVDDYRLAPFHLLATEGAVHVHRDHGWHLQELSTICQTGGPLLHPTRSIDVDLNDAVSVNAAVTWWNELTERGREGMVVKPWSFTVTGLKGLVQPAVKCRGREYLRIIYGPEYTMPENLERLRKRSLATKRNLALKEFALGVEGLERFVKREPFRRVHECVFAVLALESEPVDPRL